MKRSVDWSLYLVTDRVLALGRPLEEVVTEAVRGGVTAVQLREKECSTREFIELARRVKETLEPFDVPLLINDRADVAIAAGADGLHIGQSDIGYADARRLLGADAIIGVSVDTAEQGAAAETLDADYLGVGPIFPTQTKTDTASAWGLEGLRRFRPRSAHVLVAIGGINESNAAEAIRAGADGIAVVSAICSAPDVRAAAQRLRELIDDARRDLPDSHLH